MICPEPKIIGICGGSASGKTTLACLLQEKIGRDACAIIYMDDFYIDFVRRGYDPSEINYDHPDSIDMETLHETLVELTHGNDVHIPVYDFKTHKRLNNTIGIRAYPRIILDGLFLFNIPELKKCFSLKIFVDTPDEIRLQRRIERDMQERGRSEESVKSRFLETVLPMHYKFVLENRELADVVILGDQPLGPSLDRILNLI